MNGSEGGRTTSRSAFCPKTNSSRWPCARALQLRSRRPVFCRGGEDLPLGFEEVPLSFEELPPADPEWQGEELYNVNNPRLAAMLSSLPGNFHSDPIEGFYRLPKLTTLATNPPS
jgi:hypothetical protein